MGAISKDTDPPLQMVPGQSDGEYKNEKLAVVRQPRAKPALLGLRRAEGRENRIAHAMDAIVSVGSGTGGKNAITNTSAR